MAPKQSVPQVGDARVIGLVGAVGGLKRPPADELVVDGSPIQNPSPSTFCVSCQPPCVAGLDLPRELARPLR